MVGAAKARSQLRGKNRVTDVNAPITVSGHTGGHVSRLGMSSLRQQLEDKGYVIVSPDTDLA
jgi:hypothetical protein